MSDKTPVYTGNMEIVLFWMNGQKNKMLKLKLNI